MNNEYDNGLYGDHIKYFETETAYQTYKQAGKNVFIPNVAYANTEMIVHYNWDDDIIYDPDEIVLTEDTNPTVYNLLYNIGEIYPSDESIGFTVRDLASITENDIYKMHISDPEETEFSASIFSRYQQAPGGNYTPRVTESMDGETIEPWTFDEFKYFTGLTRLPSNFFRGCPGLQSITLPHTIKTVEYYAFHDCYELSRITLLSHVTFEKESMTYVGSDNNLIPACNLDCNSYIYNYYKDTEEIINKNVINNVKILWSDKTVYTLSQINDSAPSSGFPIGINVVDNKYVSLKYMSSTTSESGSIDPEEMIFGKSTADTDNIPVHTDVKYGEIGRWFTLKIQEDNLLIMGSINADNIEQDYKYFNGKDQTVLLNEKNENNTNDYPAAAYVKQYNPGDTNKGDWYIPEIGELIQIYLITPIINIVCQKLIQLGYIDIYKAIDATTYWSSTFYSSVGVYRIDMDDDDVDYNLKDDYGAVLAVLELPTP